jgi:hypothetical protein
MMIGDILVTANAFVEGEVIPAYRESNGQGEPERVKNMKVFVHASFGAIRNAYLANQNKRPGDLCNVDIYAGLSASEVEELEAQLIGEARMIRETGIS